MLWRQVARGASSVAVSADLVSPNNHSFVTTDRRCSRNLHGSSEVARKLPLGSEIGRCCRDMTAVQLNKCNSHEVPCRTSDRRLVWRTKTHNMSLKIFAKDRLELCRVRNLVELKRGAPVTRIPVVVTSHIPKSQAGGRTEQSHRIFGRSFVPRGR